MSELTYISTIEVSSNIEDLKVNIIKTLARWFPNNYVFNEDALDSWVQKDGSEVDVLYGNTFQFELCMFDRNIYQVSMYAIGRYRRHGSSCDFFERVMDKLEYQLKHPESVFATMDECHEEEDFMPDFGSTLQHTFSNSATGVLPTAGIIAETVIYDEAEDAVSEEDLEEDYRSISYYKNTGFIPPYGVDSGKKTTFEEEEDDESEYESEDDDSSEYDSDDEEEDEDDLIMNMPLRDMNDVQIEKYVELIGRCPRDECEEWEMVYNGGAILRYSYCKFIQWGIEDQIVSNITISRAIFDEITFTNYVFDNVHFDECVFKDIILNNTTFKNCKFIDCEMDSSIVPDDSCEVMNYDESDEDA